MEKAQALSWLLRSVLPCRVTTEASWVVLHCLRMQLQKDLQQYWAL